MFFNIICKNELKRLARSKRLYVTIGIYDCFIAIFTILVLIYIKNQTFSQGKAPYDMMMPLNIGIMFMTAPLLALIVTPTAGGTIVGERERQTLDILLSSRLTAAQIVTGKLMACVCTAVILLISAMPILMVTLMYGGISIADIYQGALYVGFFSVFIAAAGVFTSCIFRSTTTANIAAYTIVLGLTVGTGLLMLIIILAAGAVTDYDSFFVGLLLCIWLINPAVTFTGIVCSQHDYSWFYDYMSIFGAGKFLLAHWNLLSIMLQTLLIILFIRAAIYNLDPLKVKDNKKYKYENN